MEYFTVIYEYRRFWAHVDQQVVFTLSTGACSSTDRASDYGSEG